MPSSRPPPHPRVFACWPRTDPRAESIKTTVSHYSAGLDPDIKRQLIAAVEGKRVLFVGYSGRDIDVMPIINQHPPAEITWVVPSDKNGSRPNLGYEANARHGTRHAHPIEIEDAYYLTSNLRSRFRPDRLPFTLGAA